MVFKPSKVAEESAQKYARIAEEVREYPKYQKGSCAKCEKDSRTCRSTKDCKIVHRLGRQVEADPRVKDLDFGRIGRRTIQTLCRAKCRVILDR
jgi:hypothetical protein